MKPVNEAQKAILGEIRVAMQTELLNAMRQAVAPLKTTQDQLATLMKEAMRPMTFLRQNLVDQIQSAMRPLSKKKTSVLQNAIRQHVALQQQLADSYKQQIEPLVKTLANVRALQIGPDVKKPTHTATAVVGGEEVYVPLEGLIDFEAERKRLEDRIAKERAFLGGIEKKLANEKFVERAPAEVVERERARADEVRATIAALEKNLADLA